MLYMVFVVVLVGLVNFSVMVLVVSVKVVVLKVVVILLVVIVGFFFVLLCGVDVEKRF